MILGVVLWDLACLVNVAALVTAVAVFIEVPELVVELAQVEGFAALGVMAALTAPTAGVELDVEAISQGVIKDIVTVADFFSGHGVSRGFLKDHP